MVRVGNYTIDADAVDAIPESVAREECVFAIGFRDGELRVVAGNRPPAELRRAIRKVARFVNSPVAYSLADLDEVRMFVDELFTPARVHNCSVDFKVRCPQEWLQLRPTEETGVRFCEACQQRMFMCRDEHEARQHTSVGHCIALVQLGCIDVGLAAFP